MKVLVMGAGAVGSVVGGMLAKSGNDVTLVGRPWHMDAIKNNGLKISGLWGEFKVDVKAVYSTEDIEPQDLILMTTKAYDTEGAVKQILHLVKSDTLILSLQNGIGNCEIIEKYIPKSVLGGMVITGFEIVKPGEVRVTVHAESVKIGELDGKITERAKRVVDMFNQAGIPTELSQNIRSVIWGKALYNSALNPLGAILKVKYGELAAGGTWKTIEKIIEEAFEVARAEKIELKWKNTDEYLEYLKSHQLPPTSEHRSSMLQDIEKGKKTEIDFLNGVFVELGKIHGIPTPVNETLVNLVEFLEKKSKEI
ncbi:MAG: ketopantoate reductase family protein [Euryarchaeota archaeon]|nr:ketopantoate reductase family protein [Euryarchaeota archaeon]